VADAIYDFQPNTDIKKSIFSIEQTILDRPTALLTNKGSITYCLHDKFDKRKNHAQVEFIGQAPFAIRIEASNSKQAGKKVFEVDRISQAKWDVELPTFTFDSTGTYIFTIIEVSDATGCAWEPTVMDNSIRVDVVEPATIRAVHTKSDYCVGDTVEYYLQGMDVLPCLERANNKTLMYFRKGSRPWSIR
jgi:nucleoporin POM152